METNDTTTSAKVRRLACLAGFTASLAALGLLAAGCGGGSAAPSVAHLGATTSTTARSGAATAPSSSGGAQSGNRLQSAGSTPGSLGSFSACMRSHGVPNFPDPNSQGAISITSGNGVDPNSPQFRTAQTACQRLMPGGGKPPSPAQQAQLQSQMLQYSACMRSHGLPNFPDPKFSGGHISLQIGSKDGGLNPNSPEFQSAQKACQKNLPGLPATASGKAGGTSGGGGKRSTGGLVIVGGG
jgi:hypothetical protein